MTGAPQQWNSKLEYILSVIGFAVGFGNMIRFPYTCLKNGGGAFLLPYLIIIAVIAYPTMILEISLGQFTSKGPIYVFKKGIPICRGIGLSMMMVSACIAIYYNVLLSWIIFYVYKSFSLNPDYNVCPENQVRLGSWNPGFDM